MFTLSKDDLKKLGQEVFPKMPEIEEIAVIYQYYSKLNFEDDLKSGYITFVYRNGEITENRRTP